MPSGNYTAAVLTISDSSSRGDRKDVSGPAVANLLRQKSFEVVATEVVPDEKATIQGALMRLADGVSLVVTTGGTGIAKRDVTPEATQAVCGRLIEGIAERMRAEGAKKTPLAVLSRGVCGVRGQTVILNLPGSPAGAVDSLASVVDILPHILDLLAGKTGH
ncbi:MAG TPA: MogA/MoaB family molybdenum cofactor biosynthesis protein [Terriglobales bacterium]|jgi:molybdenum cofactor synthesis domain-containing protein